MDFWGSEFLGSSRIEKANAGGQCFPKFGFNLGLRTCKPPFQENPGRKQQSRA